MINVLALPVDSGLYDKNKKEIVTFLQQGRIKLIRRDSKEMYNVKKDLYFK